MYRVWAETPTSPYLTPKNLAQPSTSTMHDYRQFRLEIATSVFPCCCCCPVVASTALQLGHAYDAQNREVPLGGQDKKDAVKAAKTALELYGVIG